MAAAIAATTVTLTACDPASLDISAAGMDRPSGSAQSADLVADGGDAGGEVAPGWALTGQELEDATSTLATLPVKGKAPMTGYDRDEFGPSWTDNVDGVPLGHNGCDTRNDVLQRDLTDIVLRDGDDCIIESGVLHDPYTNTTIDFERGRDTSSAVQIDHVVSLAGSWTTGAQNLTEDQRRQIASDPRNLLASDGPANMQKG
ncbi:MAG: HNH endonuclease family protein, partial [Tomitella sp.]|nr:HNH endonuclease family protein [Tomitella sp.]